MGVNTILVDSKLKIEMTLALHRNSEMVLIVIYMPTLIMHIINQATNYLNIKAREYLGDVIKVNLSCMIVLATIYSFVSTNLPKNINY